jgi:hypothetical protein
MSAVAAGGRRRAARALPRSSAAAHAAAAVAVALLALWQAREAGVGGPAALGDVVRGGVAFVALFGAVGYAPARVLVPRELYAHLPLLVLPVGAVTTGFALTLLGFLRVPFDASLPLVAVLGAAASATARARLGPARAEAAELERAGGVGLRLLWPAYLAIVIAAIALLPVFRAGFATVVGQNGDAVLAVGTAEFLQDARPTEIDPDLAVDQMPNVWRSKYPIYYALAGVAQASGLETTQVFATLMAGMLALVALGFHLVASHVLRAGPVAALFVMGLVGLDRILVYLAIHPYHNQIWGVFALAFTLLFGLAWLRNPRPGTAVLFAALFAFGAFAYPLALPFPSVVIGVAALLDWRRARAQGRRPAWLPRLGRPRGRGLAAAVGLGLLALPVIAVLGKGIVEKAWSAAEVVLPGSDLYGWKGLGEYLPFHRFFGLIDPWGLAVPMLVLLFAAVAYGLWRAPRDLALPLTAMIAGALLFAFSFKQRSYGEFFYFKDLSFLGPVVVTLAVTGLAALAAIPRAPARVLGAAGLAAFVLVASAAARDEIGVTYDMLTRELVEVRDWSGRLPPGESVRIDVRPGSRQLWAGYMLAARPVSAIDPLTGSTFPYPPPSDKADYALTTADVRPRHALGGAVFRNKAYALWRLDPRMPGRDESSRRFYQPAFTSVFS